MLAVYLDHVPFVQVYVDDICIHSYCVRQYQQTLAKVVHITLKRGLTINVQNMRFSPHMQLLNIYI